PPAQGTLTGTVTFCDTGLPAGNALVTVTGGPSNGYSCATLSNGTYSMNLSPGSYSVQVTSVPHSCLPAGPFNATITNGGTTTLNSCLTGSTTCAFTSATVSGGNGNGIIDKDECNNLSVTVTNQGCATASHVLSILSTSTPGVTVT